MVVPAFRRDSPASASVIEFIFSIVLHITGLVVMRMPCPVCVCHITMVCNAILEIRYMMTADKKMYQTGLF